MNDLIELALFALLTAATSVGLALVLRQVYPVSAWNERGIKPWACDLCLTFWLTGLCCGWGAVVELERLWAWMPAFALAYPWLARVNPMPDDDADPGIPKEEE